LEAAISPESSANSDLFTQFLTADADEQLQLLRNQRSADVIRAWLGHEALAEYTALLSQIDISHLARKAPNLVFVPGVMGSVLASYGLGGVWWIDARTRHHLNDLRLSPDGLQDADLDHDIQPVATDIGYSPFFCAVLNHRDLGHISFYYDWRKPLAASAPRLRETVLDAWRDNGGHDVHLVAHSMGGLLVRATLMRYPELWQRVGRIVFLGTPHYGSPAIAGYLKNHLWGFNLLAVLGRYLDRTTFRSMWGVLELLPAPTGVYPDTRQMEGTSSKASDVPHHPCANFDMYDAAAWLLELTSAEEQRLQTVLNAAARFHRELYDWHLSLEQERRDRMAVIAGVGYKTLFRIAYRQGNSFLWKRMIKETSRRAGDPHRDGDGRVPLASASLEWVGETRYVRAEHGGLACVPAIYTDVFRFLSGDSMRLPRTPQAAVTAHLAGEDLSPITPRLSGVISTNTDDDPGYLWLDPPDEKEIVRIEQELEMGTKPEFNRLRIL
jgi:pimeloyl-ACP methyl ester carboxylesterase